jgi:hypothetical protein
MERQQKSILEMARGAFLERVDYEMERVIDNILDPNTNATAKRKVSALLTFTPDAGRKNITIDFCVKPALVPTNTIRTTLYVAGESSDGAPRVVEMVPQIPGQLDMFRGEQEPQAILRIIRASDSVEDAEKFIPAK